MASDRIKRATEWFYKMLYREEKITPREKTAIPEKHVSVVKTPSRPKQERKREFDITLDFSEPTSFQELIPAVTTVLLPKELREIRRMALRPESARLSREELFVRQGKLLENYTDNYAFELSVLRYFPTYQTLRDNELRGYFTWRAAWRQGEKRKTSLSFAFLYVYELLNQIGVSDPVDGFDKLRDFQKEYGLLDEKITGYLNVWLRDYVIYYRLDPILLEGREELNFDRRLAVLIDCEKHSDAELMDAVSELSTYRLDRSILYQREKELFTEAAARILRRMSVYYAKNRKQTLWESMFGAVAVKPYGMFPSAVFFARPDRPDSDYDLSPLCRYSCRRGQWTVREMSGKREKNKNLGNILKTIDAMLREATGVGNGIQPGLSTKWIVKLIGEEIEAIQREKREAEARRVTIDFSRLSAIRVDASITREKLIVDEETEETEAPTEVPAKEPLEAGRPTPEKAQNNEESFPPDALGLDAAEHRLLKCLLYGENLVWVREEGLILEVLCDSVNEKLFDRFDDTVLTMGERPEVIEDYIDDLKEMVAE